MMTATDVVVLLVTLLYWSHDLVQSLGAKHRTIQVTQQSTQPTPSVPHHWQLLQSASVFFPGAQGKGLD